MEPTKVIVTGLPELPIKTKSSKSKAQREQDAILEYLHKGALKDMSRPVLTWAKETTLLGGTAVVSADGYRAHIVWSAVLAETADTGLIRLKKSLDLDRPYRFPDVNEVYPATRTCITVSAPDFIQALKAAKPFSSDQGAIKLTIEPAPQDGLLHIHAAQYYRDVTMRLQYVNHTDYPAALSREFQVNVNFLLAGMSYAALKTGLVEIRLSDNPNRGIFFGREGEAGFLVMPMTRG